jgi:dTDP-4-dehydrorhamnose 3,5-epimerase
MIEYALKGVRTEEITIRPDERGYFTEALRRDAKELLEGDWIVQANVSYSYPDVVRAWHKHIKGQVDYFLALKGAMKICAYEEETGRMAEIVTSESKLSVVRIPGKYFHGTKTVSSEPSLTVYFVTRLYDYQDPDEVRRLWNDKSIVPTEINGKKNDPRVGKPWDWFLPPHK